MIVFGAVSDKQWNKLHLRACSKLAFHAVKERCSSAKINIHDRFMTAWNIRVRKQSTMRALNTCDLCNHLQLGFSTDIELSAQILNRFLFWVALMGNRAVAATMMLVLLFTALPVHSVLHQDALQTDENLETVSCCTCTLLVGGSGYQCDNSYTFKMKKGCLYCPPKSKSLPLSSDDYGAKGQPKEPYVAGTAYGEICVPNYYCNQWGIDDAGRRVEKSVCVCVEITNMNM